MTEITFESIANWKSGNECDLIVKGQKIATVSPPPELGGKEGFCAPEEIFAAFLASCMNTLFVSISKNSKIDIKSLDTKAIVKMNVEGPGKLIFTNIHFDVNLKLENNDELSKKKASRIYQIAQRVCPLRQSWGEAVPIDFDLNLL